MGVLALLVVIAALAIWARPRYAGEDRVVMGRELLPLPVRAGVAPAERERLLSRGKRVYEVCVACHLPQGQGVPGGNPPLVGSHIADASPGRLIRVVLHGVMGPLVVSGQSYDGMMPPAEIDSDDDAACVLSYVRTAWGNQGSLVTPAMVERVRAETRDRVEPWTTAELDALPAEAP